MSQVTFDRKVDLTNCDREPIHRLGAIQDFGALVAITNDWLVSARSVNAEAILGKAVEIGQRLDAVILPEGAEAIRQAIAVLAAPDDVERRFGIDLIEGGVPFDCAIHAVDGQVIIEIEPSALSATDNELRMLMPIMRQLDTLEELDTICQRAAEQLKAMLGIDRVMVYRFQPDGSGDVVAEAREPALESFLGLRYPHSDIPRQARALYLRNRFRIISDIDAVPVPIESASGIGSDSLDLSLSTLRSVSPIHIEYLRNMGIGASLSISIVIGGRLWGLFACHHYSAKVMPYSMRTAAELFSELFSLLVERTLARSQTAHNAAGRELHDQLMRSAVTGASLLSSLPSLRPIVQRVLPHDGASIFVDGLYESVGSAPTEEEFRAVLPVLNAAASSRVIATDALAERIPQAAAFLDRAAGALIIPISRSPRDYFVLWRKELRQLVNWAGNPAKMVEIGPNGDRLTPRKSFEVWQQSVDGRSQDWTEAERQIAESMRITLIEVILRFTDEANQERARNQQQQQLLIAELNHRVRNILNLIRGLINQSRYEAIDVEAYAEIISGRIGSLAMAHDNITRENWTPASLKELIRSEADAYLSGKVDRVIVTGKDVLIAPEAYTVLALVMHEMMTNSVKYGSLCDRSGLLEIALTNDESGLKIAWKESGGPPVKPPERRGFGSTIIERSIPFELNGSAQIDYKLTGVTAEFWIPGRFVSAAKGGNAPGKSERTPRERTMSGIEGEGRRALVVEDSMIIAIDTEECLLGLGVDHVTVQSSVDGALSALSKHDFDFALLDFNLGTESSERVAAELKRKGIPFWLATGYGEMADQAEEFGAVSLIVKPYGREEILRMLQAFKEISAG